MPSLFSRIIAGEIPGDKIYEDDLCIALLDIHPVAKGHTLLIPKQEIERLRQLPSDLLHHCMDVVQKIMKTMIDQFGCDYVKISIVGEEIPHCHIHLIPQRRNENKQHGSRGIDYALGEKEKIIQKLTIRTDQ